jgi:hypothetical protein
VSMTSSPPRRLEPQAHCLRRGLKAYSSNAQTRSTFMPVDALQGTISVGVLL